MTDYTPTTDWRQIDTMTDRGRVDLSIEIAKRVGYRFERLVWMSDESVHIYHPNGYQMYHDMSAWPLRRTPVFEAADIAYALPCYTEDLNAAFELINDVPATFRLQFSAEGIWQAFFLAPVNTQAIDGTPALAICKAWLAWHDARTLDV